MAAWLTALRWPRRRQSPESGANSVSDGELADEAAGDQLVNEGLEDGIEVHVARYLDEMVSSAESETESVRAELLQEPAAARAAAAPAAANEADEAEARAAVIYS